MAGNSTCSYIRPYWPGFESIKHLVIFGDSYSDVSYRPNSANPTAENPLGIEFPGVTWAEPGLANWVGHLITEYSPNPSLLVYDYAVGGQTVDGVRAQVHVQFLPRVGRKPDWAPWTSTDTLFITWVGINDCGFANVETMPDMIEKLFEQQQALYDAGARNFLFFDVPPIYRSPATPLRFAARRQSIYQEWNRLLGEAITKFATSNADATVMTFSSWDTFTRVLDNPAEYGFQAEDARKRAGSIWVDELHPTSKMHDRIAHDVGAFLAAQPAHAAPTDTVVDGTPK